MPGTGMTSQPAAVKQQYAPPQTQQQLARRSLAQRSGPQAGIAPDPRKRREAQEAAAWPGDLPWLFAAKEKRHFTNYSGHGPHGSPNTHTHTHTQFKLGKYWFL